MIDVRLSSAGEQSGLRWGAGLQQRPGVWTLNLIQITMKSRADEVMQAVKERTTGDAQRSQRSSRSCSTQ